MPMIIPTVIERWSQGAAAGYDIYSRLLKDRIIFVGGYEGVVTTDSANILIAQMLYLQAEDQDKEIQMFINSPGGMVTAGLAVYDTMRYLTTPITTICIGMAMSFGAVLLAAGAKGHRYALPHSRIMLHQPLVSGGLGGQVTEIEIETKELNIAKNELLQILALHTGQKAEKIRADTERNYYMSAEEAKSYGVIDEIITTRKK